MNINLKWIVGRWDLLNEGIVNEDGGSSRAVVAGGHPQNRALVASGAPGPLHSTLASHHSSGLCLEAGQNVENTSQ